MGEEDRRSVSKSERLRVKRMLARAKRKRKSYDELETAIVLLMGCPPQKGAIGWEEHEIVSELYRRLIIEKSLDYYVADVNKVNLSQERERFANQVRYRLKRLAKLGAIRTWKQWVEGRGLRKRGAEIRYYGL